MESFGVYWGRFFMQSYPDEDYFEANEEEYEWLQSLKRELSTTFLFNWRMQFNIGGVRDEESNNRAKQRAGIANQV